MWLDTNGLIGTERGGEHDKKAALIRYIRNENWAVFHL